MTTRWNDERVERVIGKLLRLGVVSAAVVVLTGGVAYLLRHGAEMPRYGAFLGEPAELRSVPGILAGALRFSPGSVIQFGLLLLIATPVARVAFSLVAFALQRDRLYVMLTGFVLAVLLISLAGATL